MGRGMRHLIGIGLAAFTLTACEYLPVQTPVTPAPTDAISALNLYYDTIPASALPHAPEGVSLPSADMALTRILIASCNDEEVESPTLERLAAEEADLFLMVGDNVYGDIDGRTFSNNQANLTELRNAFTELAGRADFQAVRAKHPMMVAWDDHDYGANDAGREFPFKGLAERVHETFWGLDTQDAGTRPGTYYARSFGEDGQRTQIIILDTRFFRSGLTPTDEHGAPGKERYIPSDDADQAMLGEAQWVWLEAELQKPADLRLIVSSIQIIPDVHGWEAWDKLPAERQRLYDLIDRTGAEGTVFVSGDRHTSFLYRKDGILPYTANEITASSLNVSFQETSDEVDPAQIGAGYPPNNFGAIEINWQTGMVDLQILDESGNMVRQLAVKFR